MKVLRFWPCSRTSRKFRITVIHCNGTSQIPRNEIQVNQPRKAHDLFHLIMIFAGMPSKAFSCIGTCRRSVGISACIFQGMFSLLLLCVEDIFNIWPFLKTPGPLCLDPLLSTGERSTERAMFLGKTR